MKPSQLFLSTLDETFEPLQQEIERLKAENKHLRTENILLIGRAVRDADTLSKRSMALALAGALPQPGTPEHDALGYKA